MFTGIIENLGIVREIVLAGSNLSFWIESKISNELKIDQSISHNGVCLTVEEIQGQQHKVSAIMETLVKTNLSQLVIDSVVNLERCMQMNSRLDGHIVQGHVDCTGVCISRINENGSWAFIFEYPSTFASLIIDKGSITINGISLTLFNVSETTFEVAIIPYTYEHTNMGLLEEGDIVNLEFDILGKYVNRIMALKNNSYLSNL